MSLVFANGRWQPFLIMIYLFQIEFKLPTKGVSFSVLVGELECASFKSPEVLTNQRRGFCDED